jgi:hypothetical protein
MARLSIRKLCLIYDGPPSAIIDEVNPIQKLCVRLGAPHFTQNYPRACSTHCNAAATHQPLPPLGGPPLASARRKTSFTTWRTANRCHHTEKDRSHQPAWPAISPVPRPPLMRPPPVRLPPAQPLLPLVEQLIAGTRLATPPSLAVEF